MEMESGWLKSDYDEYELEKDVHRLDFIRKVYSILSVQLLITTIFVLISVFSESYREFVYVNFWFFILCFVITTVILISLFCIKELHRRVPHNYILLVLFTIFEGLTISCITAFYDPVTIAIAAGCTCGLVTVLTVYAYCTKTDFTKAWGFMIVLSFALLVLGLLYIFLDNSKIYSLIFCPIFIVIYGIFLIYDTQLIVGKKRHKIGYDDYILGSLALYIDIVGIFIYLLEIINLR